MNQLTLGIQIASFNNFNNNNNNNKKKKKDQP